MDLKNQIKQTKKQFIVHLSNHPKPGGTKMDPNCLQRLSADGKVATIGES